MTAQPNQPDIANPFRIPATLTTRNKRMTNVVMIGGAVALLLIIVAIFVVENAGNSGNSTPNQPTVTTATSAISHENALPGSTDWRITSDTYAAQGEIAGYASAVSVNLGGNVQFAVSTKVAGTAYTVQLFRLGYYQGLGARQVMEIDTQVGQAQGWYVDHTYLANEPDLPPQHCATCISDPHDAFGNHTYLVDAHWHFTQKVTIPTNWVSGIYVALLTTQAHKQSYIPFIVRDDSSHSPYLFQANVATWEAANSWGGTNFAGTWDGTNENVGLRARIVSFNRPYVAGYGAGQLFFAEYNMLRFLEAKGYDVTYTTNVDISAQPRVLTQHASFILAGQDEFWDIGERNAIQSAVKSGMDLLAFAGKEAYKKVRYQADSTGAANRYEVDYRVNEYHDVIDPADPHNTSATMATGVWRGAPINWLENNLFGEDWQNGTTNTFKMPADMQVKSTTSWVFHQTGLHDGNKIVGIVGAYFDTLVYDATTPAHLKIYAASKVSSSGQTANTVLYYPTKQNFVFDAGTADWSFGIDDFSKFSPRVNFTVPTDPRLQQWTVNLLNAVTSPTVYATEAANAHP